MKPIPATLPDTGSPFPWHHLPNVAPQGYHLVKPTRLMKGDLCYHMDDCCWHPIRPDEVGKDATLKIRVCRPDRNSLLNCAIRAGIMWRTMDTADTHCKPLILRLRNGRATMGRALSIGPRYERQGWFAEKELGHPTDRRIYPTAWAPLPDL